MVDAQRTEEEKIVMRSNLMSLLTKAGEIGVPEEQANALIDAMKAQRVNGIHETWEEYGERFFLKGTIEGSDGGRVGVYVSRKGGADA